MTDEDNDVFTEALTLTVGKMVAGMIAAGLTRKKAHTIAQLALNEVFGPGIKLHTKTIERPWDEVTP